jgi:methionyl-tRNA formyltransferase
MRIVFLGTPDFAVASLKALIEHKFEVVAVVTAPDKPAGRGMQLQQSAVKAYALSQGLPLLQPEKLKSPDFIEELKKYKADVHVVVAFRMLPEVVWNMPPFGTINVHASLLPNYRGAAPINWAIINGEKETGVTTFRLKHEIDTGNILLQQKTIIEPNDNAGSLHDKLMKLGANLLVDTLRQLDAGTLIERMQETTSECKHAPKIYTATCEIDWQQSGQTISNQIRGLSPYPTAFTFLREKKLKIYAAEFVQIQPDIPVGEWKSDGKNSLMVAAVDGFIAIKELQLEGKKRMNVADFLRGFKL